VEPLGPGDPRQLGAYRLHGRLGAGGMGQVFLGYSPAGRAVAVKVIHPDLAREPQFRARFRREVAAAAAVSGAYTAPVTASGPDDDPPWLATAFVAGPSLDDAVEVAGPLPAPSVWKLAAGVVEALQAVHACGLIHRDLKPSNVLLASDGPRVIDFGISHALAGTVMTATGQLMGTPAFMSPEQAQGERAGADSDIFSLGCVITYAATGQPPFGSGGPHATVLYRVVHGEPALAGLPDGLRDLARTCLAKNPEDRPTLAALVDTISAARPPDQGTVLEMFWPAAVTTLIRSHQEQLSAQIRASRPEPAVVPAPAARRPRPRLARLPRPPAPAAAPALAPEPAAAPPLPPEAAAPLAPEPAARPAPAVGPAAAPALASALAAPEEPGLASSPAPAAEPVAAAAAASLAPGLAAPVPAPVPTARRAAGPAGPSPRPPRPTAVPPASFPPASFRPKPVLPGPTEAMSARPAAPARAAGSAMPRRAALTGLAAAAAAGLAVGGWEWTRLGRDSAAAPRIGASGPSAQPAALGSPGTSAWIAVMSGPVTSLTLADGTLVTSAASSTDLVQATEARNAVTGKMTWSAPGTGPCGQAPGVIYVGDASSGLQAQAPVNGTLLWGTSVGTGPITGITASAGRVCVSTSGGTLSALGAAHGQQLWTAPAGPAKIAADSRAVYAVTSAGVVSARLVSDGTPLWQVGGEDDNGGGRGGPGPGRGGPGPGRGEGGGGEGSGGDGGEAGTGTGSTTGSTTGSGSGPVAIAVAGGVVYVAVGAGVSALRAGDGTLIWAFTAGSAVTSGIAVDSLAAYVGTSGGRVLALATGSGALIWSFAAAGPVASGIAAAGGGVYFGTASRTIESVTAANGTRRWRFTADAPVESEVTVSGGLVYAGSTGSTVYALHA
jgi:outer membrane protein assembly factor BamB